MNIGFYIGVCIHNNMSESRFYYNGDCINDSMGLHFITIGPCTIIRGYILLQLGVYVSRY